MNWLSLLSSKSYQDCWSRRLHKVISGLLGIFDCNGLLIYCRVASVLESDDGMEDVGMKFLFL